jgi:hypothetical protein
MTDVPPSARESATGLISLVNSRLPDLKCIVCGSGKFGLFDKPSEKLRSRQNLYKKERGLPEEGAETVTIACHNCGFVHQFLEQFLENPKS